MDSETYSRTCRPSDYYYQTIQVKVATNGLYGLLGKSGIALYGYIYKENFSPLNPFENKILENSFICADAQFLLTTDLETDTTYILVVTTFSPNETGDFSIVASGPNNITLKYINQSHGGCFVGGRCQFYAKSIGMTLDDLLRDEIQPNMLLINQPFLVQMSTAVTMLMFTAGLINSILSFLTFKSKELRKVGCGMYLLASSITSLFTICLLTIKFWFVLLTHINLSTSLPVLRGVCVSLEPVLKLSVYLDSWLNACVAIERAVNVFKGVNFNKDRSRRLARWVIIILPFCIMSTLIHEPLYRELFVYNTEKFKVITNEKAEVERDDATMIASEIQETKTYENETYGDETDGNKIENYAWCMTRYSSSVQDYNTAILFFHLATPFVINLFSALFIIFGAARQRSAARTEQTYREHLREQLSEHKQLIISPIILLVLSIPRLIISLLSGCVKASSNSWLYLSGYLISFFPSVLVFVVFVLPSELYRVSLQQTLRSCLRRTRQ